MIRVVQKAEASDFDTKVRQPGLRFLSSKAISAGSKVPEKFPWESYWTHSLEDLYDDHNGVCAYSCFRMEYSLGGVTVDHFFPKKKYPLLAYEWSNYRLAASRINSRKGDHEDVLDPFTLENGWFQINFITGKVSPDSELDESARKSVEDTINRLQLNEPRLKNKRKRCFDRLINHQLTLNVLKEDAPHVHQEIIRQNLHP